MPSSVLSRPAVLLTVPLLLATGALAGCGGDDSAGASTKVAVEAVDDSCTVSETDLEAGDVTIAVENTGNKVTEVYVYAEDDGAFTKVVSEVENIGPGTSRDMDVDLAAGSYEVACKPGQSGDGIRQKIAVTGNGTGSGGTATSDAGHDRELQLTVSDSGLTGLDPATGSKGERVEFELKNATDGTRTLEILDPAGKVATEFDVPAGEDGEAVVELATTGDWTVVVEGGSADIKQTLTVS